MLYMNWFDESDAPLSDRVRKAMEYHAKKYGRVPNIVELPLNEGAVEGLGIAVQQYRNVLPNQMLLGVTDADRNTDN